MEMRVGGGGGKKEENEQEHVRTEGPQNEGTVLECSCGFQDSWQEPCGYGEFEQFVSFHRPSGSKERTNEFELTHPPTFRSFLKLDCCHPSYTPFPQIPIDLMSHQDPSASSTTFGSPSVKSEASSGERVVSSFLEPFLYSSCSEI